METITSYFATIPSHHRGAILSGGIALFWLIENAFPFIKFRYNKWHHARINIFFTLTTIAINFILAFILVKTSDFGLKNHIGLLQWLPEMNIFLYTLIGLLSLDLIGAYLPHFVQHKVKLLWRFHLIHHTDTWIDTTSANRHHPGESVIRFLFTSLGVFLVGCPIWMIFMYQSLSIAFSQFNHANICIPKKLDAMLSYFIVSPDMHKIHHHYKLPYTDSNYGNIFSVWDRLFGTFFYMKREDVVYGIDTHMQSVENNRLQNLLKIPFQKSRSQQ